MTPTEHALLDRLHHLDDLLHSADTALQPALTEAVQSLLEFHGTALRHLLDHLAETPNGQSLIDSLAEDPLVSNLLLLHDLHPFDLPSRVAAALEKVRPFLAQHHGNVELLALNDTVVRLQLLGNCHGCPSSRATLKNLIEEAITNAAPEITEIQVAEETAEPATNFIPVAAVKYNGCPQVPAEAI
jgi:Fe-S cluster biogenesis protein NfuA